MNSVEFSGIRRNPSKVVCVGRNYAEHIAELGSEVPDQMVLFGKSNASISEALHANLGEPLHYEGEICFGIEKGEFSTVGFGLDLTKRELQSRLKKQGLPWERCKAFRGSALFSPFVALDGGIEGLELELWIEGKRVQRGGVAEMIHKPAEVLAEIQSFTDLEDYDIVMTGTPKGVGQVKAGCLYEGVLLRKGVELVRHAWRAQG